MVIRLIFSTNLVILNMQFKLIDKMYLRYMIFRHLDVVYKINL